jgi:hypothetical protein
VLDETDEGDRRAAHLRRKRAEVIESLIRPGFQNAERA